MLSAAERAERTERKAQTRQFQEAATQRKAANDTQYFWDMVQQNKFRRSYSQKRVNKYAEEKRLFGEKFNNKQTGSIADNIPVERSGPNADEVPALESFSELPDIVPSFIHNNIRLMKYESPTPIQKHAIPLGLSGVDLMCCAQTVMILLLETII